MPEGGKSSRIAAKTLLVAAKPAIWPPRAARIEEIGPWHRRKPKSTTDAPRAAIVILAASVASMMEKPRMFRMYVSSNCARMMGPLTSRIGSFGKNTVPSGRARICTSGFIVARCTRKSPSNRRVERR